MAEPNQRSDGAASPLGPISAVVVNYQGEAYLEACIRSIQAQSLPVAELIVVENASTDGSLNLLNTQFRGIETLRMVENVGACTARNVGMRAAKYRWVLLVDNDVVLADDTLEHLAAAVSVEEGAVMAQPRSLFKADPTRVHYDGGDFHFCRAHQSPQLRCRGRGPRVARRWKTSTWRSPSACSWTRRPPSRSAASTSRSSSSSRTSISRID